jgi:Ca-activated chloride channel family protein
MQHNAIENKSQPDQAQLSLTVLAERRLIGAGSLRHMAFKIAVSRVARPASTRAPLAIGLVVDRSGSMNGRKIETARQAALAVVERLTEGDRVAAVVFDEQIDVLQEGAPATHEVKARLRAELMAVQPRGSTALHEGWLIGCRAIAPKLAGATLTRCFLLTDGLANRGLTDPEQISSQAANVRTHAGVGTSTFGIGDDYAEALLGPMAVAGGGQFHHLRTPADIASTFLGELGELLSVSALNVRLEIAATVGTEAEVISPYWPESTGDSAWSVTLGDLLDGEERQVIVRFAFNHLAATGGNMVRARLIWGTPDGGSHASDWAHLTFDVADGATRAAEVGDPVVLRLVAAQHAERARRLAIARSCEGDIRGAKHLLRAVGDRIARYAGSDAELHQTMAELRAAEQDLERNGYQAAKRKEEYFLSQTRSRGQRDLRPRNG